MYRVSRILNKIKDTQTSSVFSKAFQSDTQCNNNNNNVDSNNNNNNEYISFNGSKVHRTNEKYEFVDKPIRTATIKQREEIRKVQNEEENKKREIKRAMVEHHIKKDPKKKEVFEKFYQDYREKSIEQNIHAELSSRDNDLVYDEITLDRPMNAEQKLATILKQIKIDESQILSYIESVLVTKIKSNLYSVEKQQEINSQHNKEFERGKNLYIAGNHRDSFEIFNRLGNQHQHGMSLVFLGNMYYMGSDVNQVDFNSAYKCFHRAATTFNIPVAYGMVGELVYRELVNWNELESALASLTKMDAMSYSKVFFSLASELGLKSSTEQLAYLYINAGPLKNINGAILVLSRLANKFNDVNAITTIGALLFDQHPLISKDLWLHASKLGDANAQTHLGRYYYDHSKNPDYNNSLLLWTAASKSGHNEAQFYLGGMYHSGLIVEKSVTKSLQLYELSAKSGNSNAQFLIGRALIYGEGITQNEKLGLEYIQSSANNKNETAINFLNDLENENNNEEVDNNSNKE